MKIRIIKIKELTIIDIILILYDINIIDNKMITKYIKILKKIYFQLIEKFKNNNIHFNIIKIIYINDNLKHTSKVIKKFIDYNNISLFS